MQIAKGLFLLKKALNILLVQKKVVPLHTFCIVGSMHFLISYNYLLYEKAEYIEDFLR